jgi:transposase
MRPPGSAAQLESRRRKAIQLRTQGMTVAAVADQLGSSISSVVRWQQAYRKKGISGLDKKKTSGRPPNLSATQKRKLVDLLLEGPRALGYSANLWTTRRVAEVIQRKFGIHYHPNHIWRVLTGLGWSCQKPERRARERDEALVSHKKNSRTWGPSGVSG